MEWSEAVGSRNDDKAKVTKWGFFQPCNIFKSYSKVMHGDNSNYSYLCMTSGSLIRVMSCIDILDMPVVLRSLVTDRNGRTRGEAICKLIRTI